VEGWLFNKLFSYADEEFSTGKYRYLIVAGRKYSDATDSGTFQSCDFAHYAEKKFAAPFPAVSPVHIIHVPDRHWHNTFMSAVAVKSWIRENHPEIQRINVCTAGSHARKTWCAYTRIFGSSAEVGIISLPPRQPIKKNWWLNRIGLKWQVYFLGGYLYARFWPLFLLPR
jgi:hypothetical protein